MIMKIMLTLITTTFAFVAGLAWNEAILVAGHLHRIGLGMKQYKN